MSDAKVAKLNGDPTIRDNDQGKTVTAENIAKAKAEAMKKTA